MNITRRRVVDNPDCGCVTELTKDRFARKGITEIIPEAKKPNSGDCKEVEIRVRELYAMLSEANEKAEGYIKEVEHVKAEKAVVEKELTDTKAEKAVTEKALTEVKAEVQAANALAMSAKAEQAKAEGRISTLEKELTDTKAELAKAQAKLDEMATGQCEEVDIVSLSAAPVLVGTSCDTMSSLSGEEVVNPQPTQPARPSGPPVRDNPQ